MPLVFFSKESLLACAMCLLSVMKRDQMMDRQPNCIRNFQAMNKAVFLNLSKLEDNLSALVSSFLPLQIYILGPNKLLNIEVDYKALQ